jgi:hypothetical protein
MWKSPLFPYIIYNYTFHKFMEKYNIIHYNPQLLKTFTIYPTDINRF